MFNLHFLKHSIKQSSSRFAWLPVFSATIVGLSGCGSDGENSVASTTASSQTQLTTSARECDSAPYPSALWTKCEADNYAMISQAPLEGLDLDFQAAVLAQSQVALTDYLQRLVQDPSYLPVASPLLKGLTNPENLPSVLQNTVNTLLNGLTSNPASLVQLPLNTPILTECSTLAGPCVGDPFRYPNAQGPNGRSFFEQEAIVEQVTFYDSQCARLSGTLWRPKSSSDKLPGVVFEVGSVGAPETLYRWLPQLLVRNGYVVFTFEVRGQGLSDFATPTGELGTNINPKVFWTNFVDAIDFFRSSPQKPYPNELSCAGTYPTSTATHNPFFDSVDLERLGIAGHSLGAIGATAVQGYDAPGADPWPGKLDAQNPVDVAVMFDGLLDPRGVRFGGTIGPLEVLLPELLGEVATVLLLREFPNVGPRVPAMGQSSEYGLPAVPFIAPPDPEFHKVSFKTWQDAGIDVFEFTTRGSTHLDWSHVPPLIGTSFCPNPQDDVCENGFSLPMFEHYTVAWFDRWLKEPGEIGFESADARLLDDAGQQGADKMSFRFRSARDFTDRSQNRQRCEDIRSGCP